MGIKSLYNKVVTRYVSIDASDTIGGFTKLWSIDSTFNGRIRPISGSEILTNSQIQSLTTHILYCDSANVLLITDRVEIDGIMYEITDIKERFTKINIHHKEIDLRKMS